jgi:hypothetical protein
VKSDVILLYRNDLTPSDLHLMKIINFMGGSVTPVQVQQNGLAREELTSGFGGCLIASAQTLSKVSGEVGMGLELRKALLSAGSKALIYGFEPIPSHNRLLHELTSGGLIGVQQLQAGDYNFKIAEDSRNLWAALSDLVLELILRRRLPSSKEITGCSSLIRWGIAVFREYEGSVRPIVSSGQHQIADLDAKVSTNRHLNRSRFGPA